MQTLAAIPGEEIWPAQQKSARTRRAYPSDVWHFMHTLGIITAEALRQVDHRAVIAWERTMRATERAAAFDDPPAAVGAVQPVRAPGTARPGGEKSGARDRPAAHQP
jgi:hypothetical protein